MKRCMPWVNGLPAGLDAARIASRAGQLAAALGHAEKDVVVKALSAKDAAGAPVVLLWSQDAARFLEGLMAIWWLGGRAVVPAALTADSGRQHAAEVGLAITDEPVPGLSCVALNAEPSAAPIACQWPAADARVLTLYTAGSTGAPQAVSRSLAHLDAEIAALEASFGPSLHDACVAGTVPHQHIYGLVFRLLWPLACGRRWLPARLAFPEHLVAALGREQGLVLISSPAHLDRLPALLPNPLDGLVCTFSSAAPLSAASAQAWRALSGAAPIEVLGSTETGGVAWRQRHTEADPPWALLPGVRVQEAADGRPWVISPAATETDGCPLGDRLEWQDAQHFWLRGRLDRIVKLEGKRLSLDALENAVRTHAFVQDVAALVLQDRRACTALVLVLTPVGEAVLAELGRRGVGEQIRAHLADQFETLLLPRRFRLVAALPVDERGKRTQAALQALFEESST